MASSGPLTHVTGFDSLRKLHNYQQLRSNNMAKEIEAHTSENIQRLVDRIIDTYDLAEIFTIVETVMTNEYEKFPKRFYEDWKIYMEG